MRLNHIVTLTISVSFWFFLCDGNADVEKVIRDTNGRSKNKDLSGADFIFGQGRGRGFRRNGRKDFRVIGGKEADLGEFPWQAAINKVGTRQDRGTFCGGTLINERYILSAAHCFIEIPTGPKGPKSIEVLLKVHNRKLSDKEEDTLRLAVSEIIVHPKYRTYEVVGQDAFPPLDNDIALLRLANPVKLSSNRKKSPFPLCLRPDNFTIKEGIKATAAGWGLTDQNGKFGSNVLKKVDLRISPPVDCYSYFIVSFGMKNAIKAERFICTKGEKDAEGIAQGDSGGFLITKDSEGYRQIGVTSMTQYKAKGGVEFSTFFNVDLRRPWILKEMKKRDPKLQGCT